MYSWIYSDNVCECTVYTKGVQKCLAFVNAENGVFRYILLYELTMVDFNYHIKFVTNYLE